MLTVIILNGLLAVFIIGLARGLWQWRYQLQQLTAQLQTVTIAPKQMGYAMTLRRVQLAETRLGLAQLQQRSQQAKQTLRLLQLLRLLLVYRAVGSRAFLPGILGTGVSSRKSLHRPSS